MMKRWIPWRKVNIRSVQSCIVSIILCAFFCSMAGGIEVLAEESNSGNSFSVEIEFGIKGNIKLSQDVPLEVQICSQNSDFKGTMQVEMIIDDFSNRTAYEKDIALKKGKTKTYYMVIPKQYYNVSYRLLLLNSKGKIVYKNPCYNYNVIDFESACMGIVTDSNEMFDFFDDFEISEKPEVKNKIIYLDGEDLPKQKEQLEELDYLMIHNYDTSHFSEEQIALIEDWTKDGGGLILVGENRESKVFSGLPEEWVRHIHKDSSIVEGVKSINDLENPIVIIMEKDLKWQLSRKRQDKLAQTIFHAFPYKIKELQEISRKEINYTDYSGVLSFYSGFRKIPVALYTLLLLIYVLIIGPFLYMQFKKRKKREYFWFGIIATAGIFTIVVLGGSYSNRITKPVVTTLTVFNSSEGDNATVYSRIQSPNNGRLTIAFQEDIQDIVNLQYTSQDNLYGYTECRIKKEGKQYYYTGEYYDCFGISSQMAELAGSGSIQSFQSNFKLGEGTLSGMLTNVSGYDLTDVIVYFHGFYYYIEELKEGESYQFNEEDNMEAVNTQYYGNYFTGEYNPKQTIEEQTNTAIEDTIFSQYLSSFDGNQIYILGIAKDYAADYVESDVTECNKAVFMQNFSTDIPENQKYIVGVASEYNSDGTAQWIMGKDGRYYNFAECEMNYFIGTDYKAKKLLLTEPVDEKKLSMLLYNYTTNQYDDVFARGNMIVDEKKIDSYIHYGELKVKYVSQQGVVTEGKGKGVIIPRMDLLAEE